MTSTFGSPRLLLDTSVIVWLLLGDRASVSDTAQAALENPDHELLISAASVWEIAIKRSLGKLTIEKRWAWEVSRLGATKIPVTAEHAAAVEALPWHHRDPFDRLLLAQAQVEGCHLVSADRQLCSYDVPILW